MGSQTLYGIVKFVESDNSTSTTPASGASDRGNLKLFSGLESDWKLTNNTSAVSMSIRSMQEVTAHGSEVSGNSERILPNPTPMRDTVIVLFSLTAIVLTIYLSYQLWKKQRHRHILSVSSKLEDYRYSRLSQNEIEIDNVMFNEPPPGSHEAALCEDENTWDEPGMKPATLQLETDSLITLATVPNNGHGASSQRMRMRSSVSSAKPSCKPQDGTLIDELSDEDLLQ